MGYALPMTYSICPFQTSIGQPQHLVDQVVSYCLCGIYSPKRKISEYRSGTETGSQRIPFLLFTIGMSVQEAFWKLLAEQSLNEIKIAHYETFQRQKEFVKR